MTGCRVEDFSIILNKDIFSGQRKSPSARLFSFENLSASQSMSFKAQYCCVCDSSIILPLFI